MDDRLPPCVCPHARYVSTELSDPKIVCGVMERDQERADPIMEGAPVGVIISARDDASTFFAWCTGDGEPTTDPDRPTMHHSACPIFAAEKEWNEVERLFGPVERPALAESGVQPEELTDDEVRWLTEVS
jgi:hypothetical protein